MHSIKDITRETVSDYNKMSRKNKKKAKEIRKLMLDLLALAYEDEDYIHPKYYDRANDILSIATDKAHGEALYKAIMRKEGLL